MKLRQFLQTPFEPEKEIKDEEEKVDEKAEEPSSSKEIKVESESESEIDEEERAEFDAKKVEALGCSFVADVTLHDGSVVPAGSEFCKVWKVRNSGTLPWSSARLVNVGGFKAQKNGKKSEVPDVQPGEEVEVQCECKAPEYEGRVMSFFRLEDENGVKFGDRIWLDITVESTGSLHNSGSLSASSIITPSLNAGGKSASVPATATSAAPSTTFSLSEVESDFESVARETDSHFSSRAQSEVVVESDDEDDMSSSSSEESSELESEDDDDFVVLSDEGDGWRHE